MYLSAKRLSETAPPAKLGVTVSFFFEIFVGDNEVNKMILLNIQYKANFTKQEIHTDTQNEYFKITHKSNNTSVIVVDNTHVFFMTSFVFCCHPLE